MNFIKDRMLTKDELRDITREVIREEVPVLIREELLPVWQELKAIQKELDEIGSRVENVSGFRKEIDHALERIAAIEKHLAIEKRLAA